METKTKPAPFPLMKFQVMVPVFVNAESVEDARELAIECLNRGMCRTNKMVSRITHDAAHAVIIGEDAFTL